MLSSLVSPVACYHEFTDLELLSLHAAHCAVSDPLGKHGISYHFTGFILECVAAVFSRAKSFTRITERLIVVHERHLLPSCPYVPPLTMIHRFTARVDAELLDTVVNPWVVQHINARTVGLRSLVIKGNDIQGAEHTGGHRTLLMAVFEHTAGRHSDRNRRVRK